MMTRVMSSHVVSWPSKIPDKCSRLLQAFDICLARKQKVWEVELSIIKHVELAVEEVDGRGFGKNCVMCTNRVDLLELIVKSHCGGDDIWTDFPLENIGYKTL
jgi:hypothetical protein